MVRFMRSHAVPLLLLGGWLPACLPQAAPETSQQPGAHADFEARHTRHSTIKLPGTELDEKVIVPALLRAGIARDQLWTDAGRARSLPAGERLTVPPGAEHPPVYMVRGTFFSVTHSVRHAERANDGSKIRPSGDLMNTRKTETT
jgi:hypothetical protein